MFDFSVNILYSFWRHLLEYCHEVGKNSPVIVFAAIKWNWLKKVNFTLEVLTSGDTLTHVISLKHTQILL